MLSNQRGSSIVGALLVVLSVTVISGSIATQLVRTNELSHLPRIRSTMSQVEMKVRALALSPTSYLNCRSDSGVAGNRCDLNETAFTSLSNDLVMVTDVRFNPSNLEFTATIRHDDDRDNDNRRDWRGVAINPRVLTLSIPSEVLQSPTFQCPSDRPVFTGFNGPGDAGPDGVPICEAVPDTVCPAGTYVASVDRSTLEPDCQPAGPATAVGCPTNQYISSVAWTGLERVPVSCANRPDPFSYYSFTPTVTYGAATSDRDTADPTPTHPRSPSSTRWVSPDPSPTPTAPCAGSPATPTPAPGCYQKSVGFGQPPPGGCDQMIQEYGSLAECQADGGDPGCASFTTPCRTCSPGDPCPIGTSASNTGGETSPGSGCYCPAGEIWSGGSCQPGAVNGRCGSAHNSVVSSAPTSNLCADGNASTVSGSGPWTWTCSGTNGGTNSGTCTASTSINGACGSSHNQTFASAPTSNLCSTGTASSVSGSGPWTWTCTGSNGGSNSGTCTANKSAACYWHITLFEQNIGEDGNYTGPQISQQGGTCHTYGTCANNTPNWCGQYRVNALGHTQSVNTKPFMQQGECKATYPTAAECSGQ